MDADLFKFWSFLGDRIQWNFLGKTAASRCEVFPAFRVPTPSPSSECAGGLVAPELTTRCVGVTKPPAHPEDWNGVISRNVRKPPRLDAAVCPIKFHWLLYYSSTNPTTNIIIHIRQICLVILSYVLYSYFDVAGVNSVTRWIFLYNWGRRRRGKRGLF